MNDTPIKKIGIAKISLPAMESVEDFNDIACGMNEDERLDIAVAEEAYSEYVKGGKISRPISELRDECNL